jgi:hypothetical protein
LKIGEHDLQVKLSRAVKFLEQGHKVKISLLFRGREITRPELGRAILDRSWSSSPNLPSKNKPPQLSGRDLNMIVGSKRKMPKLKTHKGMAKRIKLSATGKLDAPPRLPRPHAGSQASLDQARIREGI